MQKQFLLVPALFLLLLSGCGESTASAAGNMDLTIMQAASTSTSTPLLLAVTSSLKATNTETLPSVNGGTPAVSATDWKYWPILPTVSEELKDVYRAGLENGNDPHAFSVLGDCLSQPEEFLGLYDNEPSAVATLPDYLQETVLNFSGSFDRYSPTVKKGTTAGALLWGEWNDDEENLCEPGETPLDCELRVHRPSIVFIHIGTHWETRNYRYLVIIIETIIEHGAVPVLATKVDNRELDERVNQDMAVLAVEFDVPFWNFWAAVQDLPDGGLDPGSTWELSDGAREIHRLSALEALDAVWRAVR